MVKIEAPPYAGAVVLGGVLFTIWGAMQSTTGGNTATVNVTVTNNGVPISGDITLGSLGTQTGSSVSFASVSFGLYDLVVAVPSFPTYSQSLSVEQSVVNVGVNVGTGGNPITLSNPVPSATAITFDSTVSGFSTAQSIVYGAFVHDPITGALVASGNGTDLEANGSYTITINLSPTVPTGTYPCTASAVVNGTTVSNVLSFTLTVGGGGGLSALALAGGTLSATAETVHITATPNTFSGTCDIIDTTGGGIIVPGVTITNGTGTASVNRTTSAVVIAAVSGSIASNSITVPATTGGGGLTALSIIAGAQTATAETVNVTALPATFSGTVALRNSANVLIHNVTITAGKGAVSVPKTAAAQVVHASFNTGAGLITSNTITIPAAGGGGGIQAALSGGSFNTTTQVLSYTSRITGAATAQTVHYIVQVLNSSNQPVVNSSTPATEANGTFTHSLNLTGAALVAGSYTALIMVQDSAGAAISNQLSVSFTIAGGSVLSVLINGAIGNATSITTTITVSGAPTPQLVGYSYSVKNTLGQTVASGSRVGYVSHANGTFTDSFNLSSTLATGQTYSASLFAVNGSGSSISGTLNFSITV